MPLISFPLKQVRGYMGQYVIHLDLIGVICVLQFDHHFCFLIERFFSGSSDPAI